MAFTDALDQTGDGDTDITDGTPNQYDLVNGDIAIVGAISAKQRDYGSWDAGALVYVP